MTTKAYTIQTFGDIPPIKNKSGTKRYHKENIPVKIDTLELKKRYLKGVMLKNKIIKMEELIQRYEKKIEELTKTDVFKEIKKLLKLIKGTKGHIKYHYKKFLELYD